MDIKKYEVPFTILIAVVAFLEILFLIKLLFSDFQGFEWGSVTDWISALCNVAMASVALSAARLAKNWLQPNLQQQGLSKVVAFLHTDLSLIVGTSVYIIPTDRIIDEINFIKRSIVFYPSEKQKRYNSAIEYIKEHTSGTKKNASTSNIRQVDAKTDLLKWYGYEFRDEKRHLLEKVFSIKNNIIQIHREIEFQCDLLSEKEYINDYLILRKDNNDSILTKFDKIIQKIEPLLEKQITEKRELDVLLKEISNPSNKITDFFIINKI